MCKKKCSVYTLLVILYSDEQITYNNILRLTKTDLKVIALQNSVNVNMHARVLIDYKNMPPLTWKLKWEASMATEMGPMWQTASNRSVSDSALISWHALIVAPMLLLLNAHFSSYTNRDYAINNSCLVMSIYNTKLYFCSIGFRGCTIRWWPLAVLPSIVNTVIRKMLSK